MRGNFEYHGSWFQFILYWTLAIPFLIVGCGCFLIGNQMYLDPDTTPTLKLKGFLLSVAPLMLFGFILISVGHGCPCDRRHRTSDPPPYVA